MSSPLELQKITGTIWELPRTFRSGMNVPARIYATEKLIESMDEGVFNQVANVAMLPGIVKYALCMPDGHWGYGFPIGGVAAMDPSEGVISPGGIGFDINCGMRLVLTNLTIRDVRPNLERLIDRLFREVPSGVGSQGWIKLSRNDFLKITQQGARWLVERGYGWGEDLEKTEENGCAEGADPSRVSERAFERGLHQLGTLGSGNHYLEIQFVKPGHIFDKSTASVFGIKSDEQVVIMFHCGSRGFGHQVATDYIQVFLRAMEKYHITAPDRELSCAPFSSPEGQEYFVAMKCAINISFANRQLILHQIRKVFSEVFGRSAMDLGMHQVYDVAHNTAKLEEHIVDGVKRRLLVHRKGSTRAFGPGMGGIPEVYKETGQPVIIGGSMETGSYLLKGVSSGDQTFYSTTHGSGRVMSRRAARRQYRGKDVQKKMAEEGIYTRTSSFSALAEEAGGAYKDIDEVIEAASQARISRPVVRFSPVGSVKG
ncbi:MAG: RtcB family protein [Fibrobacter sp.]|nr:RtcB family protein [Fibrobacter sp.]